LIGSLVEKAPAQRQGPSDQQTHLTYRLDLSQAELEASASIHRSIHPVWIQEPTQSIRISIDLSATPIATAVSRAGNDLHLPLCCLHLILLQKKRAGHNASACPGNARFTQNATRSRSLKKERNMRLLAAALFLILASGLSLLASARNDAKPPEPDDLTCLQGNWKIVELEGDGQRATDREMKHMRWSFKENQIQATNLGEDLETWATFTLDSSADPKQIDLTIQHGPDKGKILQGIFKLAKNRLTVCTGEIPAARRPTEFSTSEGSSRCLFTLERVDR
jgi:uncharacterized protein (TIGR03067 family)